MFRAAPSRLLRSALHRPPALTPLALPRLRNPYSTQPHPPAPALFSLTDKVAIVTGGARGIGFLQATALIESGATVYAFDLPPTAPAAFAEYVKTTQSPLHYRPVDVRSPEALAKTIREITDTHSRLDGVIAAAGINQETPALDYTKADFQKIFDINTLGVFLTLQAAAREMIRLNKPGSLVAIASMSARIANRGLICAPYNSSKAAVAQMVRGLAAEWGGHGIRVNSLSPGYARTEMVEMLFVEFPERRQKWAEENMLGRLSEPEDYRGPAVFLLSDASAFMTGADLLVDGGHSAW